MRTLFLIIKRFFAVEGSKREKIKNKIVLAFTFVFIGLACAYGYTEAYIHSHNIMYDSVLTAAEVWGEFGA
jgi:hypothetical protein